MIAKMTVRMTKVAENMLRKPMQSVSNRVVLTKIVLNEPKLLMKNV